MKKIYVLLLTFILWNQVTCYGQTYVTIPDANFRAYLQSIIPNSFNGTGQMDITSTGVTTRTLLFASRYNIQDLTGVEYFTSLTYLYCSSNQLTSLPLLPTSLTNLECNNNQLISLANLPLNITHLYCKNNQLSNIASLPANLSYLDCSNNQLSSLPVVPNTTVSLNCSNNLLTTLPSLPNGLWGLDCSNNLLTNLGNLAQNISYLSCHHNQLAGLGMLPSGLTWLDCSYNTNIASLQFTSISIEKLNIGFTGITNFLFLQNKANLKKLDISGLQLNALPLSSFPLNLTTLSCAYNQLIDLNTVPTTIVGLNCSYNNLTNIDLTPFVYINDLDMSGNPLATLPSFPNTLRYLTVKDLNLTSLNIQNTNIRSLDCSHNQINFLSLPTGLPPFDLITLNCSYNFLTTIPPSYYFRLDCSHNLLTYLPNVPYAIHLNASYNQLNTLAALSADTINLSNNPLNCVPELLDTVYRLDISNTFITCVPSSPYMWQNTIIPANTPFCATGTGLCTAAQIQGKVYLDDNNNQIQDAGEANVANVWMEADNAQFGKTYKCTDAGGNFSMPILPNANNYSLRLFAGYWAGITSIPFSVTPSAYNITVASTGQILPNNNFSLYSAPFDDLELYAFHKNTARPGFDLLFRLYVYNDGTTTQNATLSFTYDANYAFVSSSVTPTTQIGNTLTYDFPNTIPDYASNFLPMTSCWMNVPIRMVEIVLHLPTTVPLGTILSHNASIQPTTNDVTPANNIANFTQLVINSYDPNQKLVNKATITPQEIADNQKLEYKIDFQNTGTDTAYTVVITDTLSAAVEPASVEILAASHYFNMDLRDNHILVWTFPNIMLPDSNIDEPRSHGFIAYKIKPKANLTLGTQIQNTANIYFDFNEPIVTNTAITTVTSISHLSQINSARLSIYPNPSKTNLTIEMKEVDANQLIIKLIEVTGKVIYEERVQDIANSFKKTIELATYNRGVYLLQIETDKEKLLQKVVLE
ncbi:MAG: T9SS type A sorting domain-containing protein [Bacteroidia bacterium]